MTVGFRIRAGAAEDFPALLAIDRASFDDGVAYDADELAYAIGRPAAFTLVAEDGRRIVGFLVADADPLARRAGLLVTIDVIEDARRRGVGSALLERSEAVLARNGIRRYRLQVETSNAAAVAFYTRRGFRKTRKLRGYYGPGRHAYLTEKAIRQTGRWFGTAAAPASPPSPRLSFEQWSEFSVSVADVLGQHARLSRGRHEVGVTRPAGHDVQVDVVAHAGAGAFPYVHPDVEPVGTVRFAEDRGRPLRQPHHLGQLVGAGGVQGPDVPIGRDHQVTRRVGVEVHDDETEVGAVQDEPFAVVAARRTAGRNGRVGAEDTGARFPGGRDVIVPPRTPQNIHGTMGPVMEERRRRG